MQRFRSMTIPHLFIADLLAPCRFLTLRQASSELDILSIRSRAWHHKGVPVGAHTPADGLTERETAAGPRGADAFRMNPFGDHRPFL